MIKLYKWEKADSQKFTTKAEEKNTSPFHILSENRLLINFRWVWDEIVQLYGPS